MAAQLRVNEELAGQALLDLCKRTRAGAFFHLPMWLVLTLPFAVPASHPLFFYINTTILLLTAVLRGWLHSFPDSYKLENRRNVEHSLTAVVLFSALHWGVLTAVVLTDSDLVHLQLFMMLAAAGFASAGTCTMSISSVIRVWYPALMVVPGLAICLIDGTQEKLLFALMASLFVVFITIASRTMHSDYWQAVSNRYLSELRADEMLLLSITDPLTQLKNRMYFDQQYASEWKRALRAQNALTILLLDLDYFKRLNDSYGHLVGDRCLSQVAESMMGVVQRSSDFCRTLWWRGVCDSVTGYGL